MSISELAPRRGRGRPPGRRAKKEPAELSPMMRAYRAQGCRLAGVILRVAPERVADMTIGRFLLEIPYVDERIAGKWLARAGVNPWRLGKDLKVTERMLIIGQLIDYSKVERQ